MNSGVGIASLILFATLATAVEIRIRTVVAEDDPICTAGDGYYPDPDDCHVYYVCASGEATRFQCAAGAVFDPTTDRCEVGVIVSGCAPCTAGDGYYPDPDDCHVFYVCESGEATRFQCAAGGVFDPSTNRCEVGIIVSGCAPCTAGDGNYPDPDNCSVYYVCESGESTRFQCAAGGVFDPRTNRCEIGVRVPGCIMP